MKKVKIDELITRPVMDEHVVCPYCAKPIRLSFNEHLLAAELQEKLTPIEQLKRDYVYAVEKPI